jgi:coenzyme F420-reducing hydrogenase beta subunit
MNNINQFSKIGCTGCGVCAISCNVEAINMVKNEDGFFVAKVDEEKCVNCGMCKNLCYRFSETEEQWRIHDTESFMAFSNNNEVLKTSTSGGIGYEITKFALENGYKVIGAYYNNKENRVEHKIIEQVEEIPMLTGSKYLQSYTFNAFKDINDKDKYVIIGTPCQIYGLRRYIEHKKIEDHVLLVDFFCHGVPGYNLWDKYLEQIRKDYDINEIKEINFRCKDRGWHTFLMKIKGNSTEYLKEGNEDLFYKFFLSESCLNEDCYECSLRFNKLYSDIRIGDFWGEKCKDNNNGVSVILCKTEKGKEIIINIKENLQIKKIDFQEVSKVKEGKLGKKQIPKYREELMKILRTEEELKTIYSKYLYRKIKINNIKAYLNRIMKKLIEVM